MEKIRTLKTVTITDNYFIENLNNDLIGVSVQNLGQNIDISLVGLIIKPSPTIIDVIKSSTLPILNNQDLELIFTDDYSDKNIPIIKKAVVVIERLIPKICK